MGRNVRKRIDWIHMKLIKDSVAFVIYGSNRSNLLVVRRPFDDDSLPGMWGLPAGTLKEGESYSQCVLRAGREKLGVELKIVNEIGEDELDREDYFLHLIDYEATIIKGIPSVRQYVEGVTQYTDFIWSSPDILTESARNGSLCSRIFLD